MPEYSQLKIARQSPAFWTVTFDHPPINLIDPDTIRELDLLISDLETDPQVRVVVFNSANSDFFLAHFDVLADKAKSAALKLGKTGLHPWIDVLIRLSRLPVVTIASIRGRARGAGSEFVLACDIRLASVEGAVLGQFEVGVGAVPGGGPMARLPGLMGRGRTLEVLLGADDFPGLLAERYGYVNRAMPDAELDAFVTALATRISQFDKSALSDTKALVDQATLPPDAVFSVGLATYFRSVARPQTQARTAALVKQGLQQYSDVELRLGYHVGCRPAERTALTDK